MSAQRARSAVTADQRSAHPNVPGVAWWGAVLIAATFTAIGFAFDAGAGNKELSFVFAATYVLGCVGAVLAVRQSGIFTAVIQPPLLLFVSVPTAYFLFAGAKITSIRDTVINCGYPLIERFPLMFFTSAFVLFLGLIRWYQAAAARRAAPRSAGREARQPREPKASSGLASAVSAKVAALLARDVDEEDAEEIAEPPRRRRARETPPRKPARRAAPAPSRSRHTRPPETEIIEPVAERPRRARTTRRSDLPPVPPPEPRRRPRPPASGRRAAPPPTERRTYDRPERRRRYDDYQPLEPHGRNGNGTHHPVSRVRYRGAEDAADSRVDYRPRPRAPRSWEADSWEYDV
ncbi:DUF6542 domain-containing protein [Mycolicibacterium sp. XJ1819]